MFPLPPGAGARGGAGGCVVARGGGGDASDRRRARCLTTGPSTTSRGRWACRAATCAARCRPSWASARSRWRRRAGWRWRGSSIVDTALPMTEVAFAAGYRSVRRFNAAVRARYARPPSAMRRTTRADDGRAAGETLTVTLHYRPPYDWPAMLSYFVARAIPGDRAGARRRLPAHRRRRRAAGLARGHRRHDARWPRGAAGDDLDVAVGRADGRGRAAAAPVRSRRRSRRDRRAPGARSDGWRRTCARGPGLRVAGAFDPFEVAVRTVLGQQVSVAAARTIAGRLAARLGEAIVTPHPELARLFPRAEIVARANAGDIAALGIPGRRAATLLAIARAVSRGELALDGAGESGADRRTDRRDARRRTVDRPLPGDARARLARRFPGGGSRPAQGAGRRLRAGGARRRRTLATLARLRRHASLEWRRKSAMSNPTTVFTTMPSPVGQLTLVGDGDDLSGLFFDGDANAAPRADWTRGRSPPASGRRPATGVLRGQAHALRSASGAPGDRVPEGGLGGAAPDPVRRRPPATATSRARSASPPRRARSAAPTTVIRSRSSSPATA